MFPLSFLFNYASYHVWFARKKLSIPLLCREISLSLLLLTLKILQTRGEEYVTSNHSFHSSHRDHDPQQSDCDGEDLDDQLALDRIMRLTVEGHSKCFTYRPKNFENLRRQFLRHLCRGRRKYAQRESKSPPSHVEWKFAPRYTCTSEEEPYKSKSPHDSSGEPTHHV